jgi:hypothetical protein
VVAGHVPSENPLRTPPYGRLSHTGAPLMNSPPKPVLVRVRSSLVYDH